MNPEQNFPQKACLRVQLVFRGLVWNNDSSECPELIRWIFLPMSTSFVHVPFFCIIIYIYLSIFSKFRVLLTRMNKFLLQYSCSWIESVILNFGQATSPQVRVSTLTEAFFFSIKNCLAWSTSRGMIHIYNALHVYHLAGCNGLAVRTYSGSTSGRNLRFYKS